MNLHKTILLSILINWSQLSFAQLVADFFPNTPRSFCAGEGQNFNDISTGNPNFWLWDFGDGDTSHQQNPLHPYYIPGLYTVTLIVSDGVSYDTITRVDLIDIPYYPNIAFSYSNISVPAPFTVTFDNNSDAGSGSIFDYYWTFGDQQGDTTWNPIHTYASSGTYSVCLIVTNTYLCVSQECDSIEVFQANCSAFFDLYPDTVPHRYYAINMTSGASPLAYSWDWGDGNIDTVPFPSHIYDTAGYYTICLTIMDLNGCTDTFCNSYNLLKTSNAIVEVNVIPPLNTGIIGSHAVEPILIFPNPASNNLTINLSIQNARADIKVFNTLGQLELSSRIDNQQTILDISGLTSGIYVLEVATENNISRQKFIKE